MDKAEEFAISVTDSLIRKWVSEGKITDAVRVVGLIKECVMLGYRQAEQDTALTCKDDIEYIRYDYLMKWARKYISRLSDGCVGQRQAMNNLIDMLNEVDDHVPFLID